MIFHVLLSNMYHRQSASKADDSWDIVSDTEAYGRKEDKVTGKGGKRPRADPTKGKKTGSKLDAEDRTRSKLPTSDDKELLLTNVNSKRTEGKVETKSGKYQKLAETSSLPPFNDLALSSTCVDDLSPQKEIKPIVGVVDLLREIQEGSNQQQSDRVACLRTSPEDTCDCIISGPQPTEKIAKPSCRMEDSNVKGSIEAISESISDIIRLDREIVDSRKSSSQKSLHSFQPEHRQSPASEAESLADCKAATTMDDNGNIEDCLPPLNVSEMDFDISFHTKQNIIATCDMMEEKRDDPADDFPGEENGTSEDDFEPHNERFGEELDFLEQFGTRDSDAIARQEALARQSLYVKFDPLVKGTNKDGTPKGKSRNENLMSSSVKRHPASMAAAPKVSSKDSMPLAVLEEAQTPKRPDTTSELASLPSDPFSPRGGKLSQSFDSSAVIQPSIALVKESPQDLGIDLVKRSVCGNVKRRQSEKERSAEGGQGDDVECVKSCNQLAKDGKGPNVRELAAFSGLDVPNVNNKERKRVKEMYTKSSYSSHLDGYEPLLYSQSDLDEVLRAREEDWKMKEEGWKAKVKEEVSIRELIEEDFKEKMQKLRDENVEMKKVVEEYAKTIIDLSENSKKDSVVKKETLSSLVQEKEQLHKDLDTTEASLLEAYKRIDKMKVAIESYKKNEELLKGSNEDALDKLTRSEEKYLNLKKHVQEKIDQANTEIAKVRKSKEVDMAGLQAANKKLLSKITTLEQALEQKCKENEELTTICDDLISRVSQE